MFSLPELVHWIQVFAYQHDYLIYGVLYILALIEGHVITIISGLFIRFGNLYIIPTALSIILGNLTGDIILYWAGYHWGEKFVLSWGKYLSITDTTIVSAKKIFSKYHATILLGSKLTNGFGLATVILFTAGMTRISFIKYMSLNIIGETAWTSILLLVGYSFGQLYVTINNIIGRVFLIVIAGVIIFGFIRMSKYLRIRLEKQ